MNIDVREYLRINPISVHDLTLSGEAKDCFLCFPGNGSETDGYVAFMQKTIFWALCQSIFQNLVDGNEDDFRFRTTSITIGPDGKPIITWEDGVHLNDAQFSRYQRRYVWEAFRTTFEADVLSLIDQVDRRIFDVLTKAKLFYCGAVELQSSGVKRAGWEVPVYGVPRYNRNPTTGAITRHNWASTTPIYSDFSYFTGGIWCHNQGKTAITGSDVATLGTEPLLHTHKDTKAETMTISFSSIKGGGKLVGNYTVGQYMMASYDNNYGETLLRTLGMRPGALPGEDDLTYPLYGQNVINWRTRRKTHNNVPPSTNIHIRCKPFINTDAEKRNDPVLMQAKVGRFEGDYSAAEAQYIQSTVPDLEEDYKFDNLTVHDYLLRISTDGSLNGEVKLMKQTVPMFLDIFADDEFHKLSQTVSGVFVTMEQILEPLLDMELIPIAEFMEWYFQWMGKLDEIYNKILKLKGLLQSVKPINYTGRIIISTTDDVEEKVIEHYGGKRWRRIVNFLRGVERNDGTLGRKLGEEYVCLRESNIPVHTHQVTLQSKPTTGPEGNWWMKTRTGGQKPKLLNADKTLDVAGTVVNGLKNTQMDYQISPLEYEVRSKDNYPTDITIPHDNLPPYREVYIWECIESGDDEPDISGEPPDKTYNIIWDPSGGTFTDPAETGVWNVEEGTVLGRTPGVSRPNYTFAGWYDDAGNSVTSATIATSDAFYHAEWQANKFTVTFHGTGAKLLKTDGTKVDTLTREYDYGERIGEFPEITDIPNDAWSGRPMKFDMWSDALAGGNEIGSNSIVEGNMHVYIHWIRYETYRTVNNEIAGVGGTDITLVPDGEDYIASGFDTGKYLETTHAINFNSDFEIVICAETGEDVYKNQEIFAAQGTLEFGLIGDPALDTSAPTGRFMWEVLTPGNVYPDSRSLGEVCEKNTIYYWKLIRNNSTKVCTCYHSTDGVTWIQNCSPTVVNRSSNATLKFGIEDDRTNIDATETIWGKYTYKKSEPFLGHIYMDKSYIIIGGNKYLFRLEPRDESTVNIRFDSQGGTGCPSRDVVRGKRIGTLPTTTKADNLFLGWFTSPTAGVQITADTLAPSTDTIYYAHWRSDLLTVTFNGNGGTVVGSSSVNVKYNNCIPTLPTATRSGYDFMGWWTLAAGGIELTTATPITANGTYYAHWTATSYTITWDSNGGSSVSPYIRTNGSTIGTLPNTTRSGFSFDGWYTAKTGGTKITASRTVSGNATYYAHWSGAPYTMYFNPNGGTTPTSSKTVHYMAEVGELPTATRSGYSFAGWYNSDFEWDVLKVEPTSIYTLTKNISVMAHWATGIVTVTWNPNGGSYVPNSTLAKNSQVGTLPTSVRTGYDLSGWYTAITGGSLVTTTRVITENTTFYARWNPYTYTVAYNANGGTGSMANQTHTYGSSKNLTSNAFTKPGPKLTYSAIDGDVDPDFVTESARFSGWSRSPGGTTEFNNGQSVTNLTTIKGATVTLYAVWSNQFTTTLPTPTRPGYSCMGWSKKETGGSIVGHPGDEYEVTESHTLYAQWVEATYTITFNANGGTPATQSKSVAYGGEIGEPDTPVTRSGYEFKGWWTAASGGIEVLPSFMYCHDGDTTYYAHWEEPNYLITEDGRPIMTELNDHLIKE